MRAELGTINQSAVGSLDEGFEETLTLHRLGLGPSIGLSRVLTHWPEIARGQAESPRKRHRQEVASVLS